MFTVEEICEEQERQYNQLMQEDAQYCHPESFKWGFEHGVDYALTKAGWHPASELPPLDENGSSELVYALGKVFSKEFGEYIDKVPCRVRVIHGKWAPENIEVKWWCYLPKEE